MNPKNKMKFFLYSILLVLLFNNFAAAQTFYGTDDLKIFRAGREQEFRNKDESPLKENDFSTFNGLRYFSPDKRFLVKAKFKRTTDERYFQMPTSSGKSKKFIKYGILSFKIAGNKQNLNVYQADSAVTQKHPEYADLLFIPFKDLTNGIETYGGGRYIDIKKPAKDSVILNFNLAYNPNCAYGSDRYNCPIPPKENNLRIKIEAGEKKFNYSGEKH